MIVLASKSGSRQAMLAAAGVAFAVQPADLDERALEASLTGAAPDKVARLLARAKAQAVSGSNPGALVLGSDSLVVVEGRRFDKPRDRAEAAEHVARRAEDRRHHALGQVVEPHRDAVALARQIEHLRALVDAGQMAAPQEGAACIAAALRLGSVRRLDLADGARIVADAREAAMLAYFRNNVLHLYALPALVASLLIQHEALTESRLDDMAAGLFGLLRDSLFLRCTLGDLPRAVDGALARLASRGLVERAAGWACAPRAGSEARTALAWIGETVRPLLTAVSAGSR